MKALVIAAALSTTAVAHAQRPLMGAFVEGGSGVALGGGDGFMVLHRERTFLRAGGTVRFDEMPNELFSVAVRADLEPFVALGVEARWGHWVDRVFLFQAGAVAYLLPETLLGVTGGLRVRVALGKTFSLLPGFDLTGYFAGSDLPNNAAIVSGTFVLGIHADLF